MVVVAGALPGRSMLKCYDGGGGSCGGSVRHGTARQGTVTRADSHARPARLRLAVAALLSVLMVRRRRPPENSQLLERRRAAVAVAGSGCCCCCCCPVPVTDNRPLLPRHGRRQRPLLSLSLSLSVSSQCEQSLYWTHDRLRRRTIRL